MSAQIKIAKAQVGGVLPGAGMVRGIPQGGGYAGDPGIFGSIFKGITGAVGGLLSGGPLGAIGGAARGLGIIKAPTQGISTMPIMGGVPPTISMPYQSYPQVPKPGIIGAAQRFVPGGATGMMDAPAMQAGRASSPGYHWNKSGYFLKSGEWVAAGTKQVRNRKMNPLNPRAVRSSITRLGRAKTAAKDIGRVTIRAKKCAHR